MNLKNPEEVEIYCRRLISRIVSSMELGEKAASINEKIYILIEMLSGWKIWIDTPEEYKEEILLNAVKELSKGTVFDDVAEKALDELREKQFLWYKRAE